MSRGSEWYSDFWERIEVTQQDADIDGMIAVRLLADLLDHFVIERQGDHLVGNDPDHDSHESIELDTEAQYLVRRIEDVVGSLRVAGGMEA